METPHSARSESPVRLPMAELDDHRNQPQSLPPRTYSNTISQQRPDLTLIISDFDRACSPASVRSFEHAVADDNGHFAVNSRLPDLVNSPLERRGSIVPGRVRADSTTVRCGRPQRRPESRSSSRTPSPPNSVEAFADPDRRRAERSATISSHAPTDLGLQLRRTISRRNTFDDGEIPLMADAASLAQEDVCFPMPEATKINGYTIDFEEMEEFVAEQRKDAELSDETCRRASRSSGLFSSSDDEFLKDGEKQPSSGAEECDDKASICVREKPGHDHYMHHPNRFSFFSSEIDNTIHAPEIGYLLCEGESFKDLFQKREGIWWLDVYNPTDAEFRMLMKAFCIHPLTAEDIRTQEAREKVELFKSYYFVSFRSFVQDRQSPDFMKPHNVYCIVFREGVLSFYFKPAPHSGNVRKRIRQLRDYVSLSPDWICYALIDDITDSFGPVIQQIEEETDVIEDNVFTLRDDDQVVMLKQIGECRKKVMSLMRLLGGKADVIKGFAKRCNEQFSMSPRQDIGLYLGDIQDHIITMMSNLSHAEKMLSRSHSNYLAQLSVEGIRTNNAANEALAKITTLATILVPMNLICGLFGMNVPVPGQHSGSLAWWFSILGVMITFVVVSYYSAKKLKLV